MKRIYILDGLDCAHCAEEIRAEVEKDERVKSAEMNFMKQEITVETEIRVRPMSLWQRSPKLSQSSNPT